MKLIAALACALTSALLLTLSFPYPAIFIAAWAALVPLFLVIEKTGRRQSFIYGLIAGIAGNAGIFYWLYPMLMFNTGSAAQSILCVFLLSAYLGLYVAVWAWFSRILLEVSASKNWFVFISAALWVSLEYLRTYLLSGFPWALLGYSQWNFLPIAQVAEFTGVYGVSFLLVAVSGALTFVITGRRWNIASGIVLALLGISFIFGTARSAALSKSSLKPVKVAVVQPNIDQYKKWDPSFIEEILQTFNGLISEAGKTAPDLILWPETGVPGYLPYAQDLLGWVQGLVRRSAAYNIVGAPYYAGGNRYHNATVFFAPDGNFLALHTKTHLIPFGEYVPFRKYLEPYFGVLNSLGDFTATRDTTIFVMPGASIGATICSENFFGSISRRFVKAGATILANQTNDAWFFKTAAADQHFSMNVFRAIENRRPVIVSGNTGVSGSIDAYGRVERKTGIFEKSLFTIEVKPRQEMTFYTKFGDVFAVACVIFSLLSLPLILFKRKYIQ